MSFGAREAAFLTLRNTFSAGKYSNIALDGAIKKYNLEGREKASFTRLYYGCIEKKLTLQNAISQYSERDISELDPSVYVALLLSFYQLLYMDSVPDHSAVDESVELVKKYGKGSTSGYVNAVSRAFLRADKKYKLPEDDFERLSVVYSVNPDIIKELCEDYGREKTEEILRSFETEPYISLRVNTLKTDKDTLCKLLEDGGAEIADCDTDSAVIIKKNSEEVFFKYLEEGYFYVQDISSQIAVSSLDARPGQTVADVCAAPGGKSIYCAIDMKNDGRVISLDLHKNKLSLIKKQAEKLGIDIIETGEQDARTGREELDGISDCVICDVPCSGLGVIVKKPEIRYKNISDFENLEKTQAQILERSAKYLKNGGRLLYSTCTLRKKENGKIVEAFLKSHPDFEKLKEETVFPGEYNDGFYYSVLCKK